MEGTSVARETYTPKKGERYEAKKPQDSQILNDDGSFVKKTQKEIDYVAKKGERYQAVKPKESDIWTVSTTSVYRRTVAEL